MWLSQISADDIAHLTEQQKNTIVYGGYADDGGEMDGALLLGSKPCHMDYRAKACLKLYGENRIKYFVPCGGVIWDTDDGPVTEADYMTGLLLKGGIPGEMILPERESRTTKENMICATLQLSRKLGLSNMHRVLIVTSPCHLRRSVALAKALLPKTVEVFGHAAEYAYDGPGKWIQDPVMTACVERNIQLLRKYILEGLIEDIAF